METTDLITKKRYAIPTTLQKKWPLYQHRYTLGISMGVLLWTIGINPLFAALLAVAFLGVAEFRFRSSFLPQCKEIKASTKVSTNTLKKEAVLLNATLYLLLAVGVGYMIIQSDKKDLSSLILMAVALGASGLSLSYFVTFLTQKK